MITYRKMKVLCLFLFFSKIGLSLDFGSNYEKIILSANIKDININEPFGGRVSNNNVNQEQIKIGFSESTIETDFLPKSGVVIVKRNIKIKDRFIFYIGMASKNKFRGYIFGLKINIKTTNSHLR